MSTPPGVTRRNVSFGNLSIIESGDDVGALVTIRSTVPQLTWAATGQMLVSQPYTVTMEPGSEIVVPLIVGDLDGWLLNGQAVIVGDGIYSHAYSVTVQPVKDGRNVGAVATIPRLVVPTGDGVLDADLSIPYSGPTGVVVNIPDSWNGRVTAAEAAALSAADEAAAAAGSVASVVEGVGTALAARGLPTDGDALNGEIAGQVAPVATLAAELRRPMEALLPRRAGMPNIYSLLAGTPDEGMTKVSGDPADTIVRTTSGERGWKLTKIGGGTTALTVNLAAPLMAPPAQAVCLDLDISDASQFDAADRYIAFRIYTDAGLTVGNRWDWGNTSGFFDHKWTGPTAAAPKLVNGKNRIRIAADFNPVGVGPTWGNIHKIELLVRSTTSVNVTFNHIYLETPPKVRMLVINDRGYKTFYDYAYPKLRAADIPVCFALDPGLEGTGTGENVAMTSSEIAAVAHENNNEISFHAWQGAVTSAMTADQLTEDTMRCIKHLQAFGHRGRMWRAAFTQGSAPEWAAIQDLVLAARSGMDTSPRHITPWPAIHRMKIPAQQIDNFTMTSNAVIDQRFDLAKRTRGLIVPFFHAIGTGQFNTTAAKFDYWLSKAAAGIAEGWIEPVTFEQLFFEMGGRFSSAGGATLATWTDPDGSTKTQRVY